jgi:hypothetical protein
MLTIVPSFNHLVPALLHSLWQATVLALLLTLLLRRIPARQANLRYLAACARIAWSLCTFLPYRCRLIPGLQQKHQTQSSLDLAHQGRREHADAFGQEFFIKRI